MHRPHRYPELSDSVPLCHELCCKLSRDLLGNPTRWEIKPKMATTEHAGMRTTRVGLERSTKNYDFLHFILETSSTWQFPSLHHILAFPPEGTASADPLTTFRP
ncbi:hypothetical protein OAH64_00570 [bacterium]|nr:hypothetical protein [bacterium]MDC0290428.1 hypothetical protein [Akkermansiaceae bacterium]